MSEPALNPDQIFSQVEANFGSHPEFAANGQRIRDLINAIAHNPQALTPVFSFLAILFPQAAPVLNGIPAVLAVLTPHGGGTDVPAPGPAPSVTTPVPPAQAATHPNMPQPSDQMP